jgi:catalase
VKKTTLAAERFHSRSNSSTMKESTMSESAAPRTVIAEIVEIMRALAGSHPGFRPVHAKGIVCSGTFRGAPQARDVSRAAHLQGQAVPIIIRFANASGNPDVHDGLANVRSLAVKFQLADSKNADILANSVEGFPVRTPEEFLAFLRAQLPDPGTGQPAPDAVPQFLGSHPAARAFIERLSQKPVPASYGQASFHAEHAFRFTAADGASRFGRYHWVPEAGEAYLSPDDASTRDANFLRQELESRLRNGPVSFRLLLQLAGEGDPTDDVTALWPTERTVVELGRLEVTGISPTSAADERRLVFDPTNLTDGIDLSADPILLARSAAYSISYDHRSKGT